MYYVPLYFMIKVLNIKSDLGSEYKCYFTKSFTGMVIDPNSSKFFHLSAVLLFEMKPFNFHTPTYI